jgi:hypothetical protein
VAVDVLGLLAHLIVQVLLDERLDRAGAGASPGLRDRLLALLADDAGRDLTVVRLLATPRCRSAWSGVTGCGRVVRLASCASGTVTRTRGADLARVVREESCASGTVTVYLGAGFAFARGGPSPSGACGPRLSRCRSPASTCLPARSAARSSASGRPCRSGPAAASPSGCGCSGRGCAGSRCSPGRAACRPAAEGDVDHLRRPVVFASFARMSSGGQLARRVLHLPGLRVPSAWSCRRSLAERSRPAT